MSMRNVVLFVIAACAGTGAVLADDGPGLGQEMTAEEVAAIDFTVMADGNGLPEGSGNAIEGRRVYNQNCLCHRLETFIRDVPQ